MTPIADDPLTNPKREREPDTSPKHERGPDDSPKRQQGSATATPSQSNAIGSVAQIAEPSGTNESRIMQALQEYRTAREAGANPDRQKFLTRHSDIANELAQCLEALDFVYEAAPKFQDSALEPAGLLPTSEVFRTSDVSADAQPPLPLGDYQIIREIGRGGMGVVYEAIQLSLGRRVALKVLPLAGALDARQLQRFKNEAHAAAHLQHQNIVPVYFVGCERGVHFYAMQFVEGQTLAALIQELRQSLSGGRKPPEQAEERPASRVALAPGAKIEGRGWQEGVVGLDSQRTGSFVEQEESGEISEEKQSKGKEGETIVAGLGSETVSAHPRSSILDSGSSFFRTVANLGIQAAEALEYAHQMGVIHRDIKPANLIIEPLSTTGERGRGEGAVATGVRLWITDFGLAHCQGGCELTMSGDLLGTLRYMSPEQALAQRVLVDQRTDIYSLGATLYELLTLEPAFPGTDRQEVLRQIAFDDPKPPRRMNKAIPPELETIVLKAMEKSPADRYATAQELADDLARYLENKPIRARRPSALARLRKWSYRHRGAVSAAMTSALLVLGVTSGITFWQWRVAVKANGLAETRRSEAEQAASTVRAINQYLINDLLNASTPQQTLGRKVTVEEVLDNAERKIGGAFPEQPLVEAGVRIALASAYDGLGLYPKAEFHLKRALAIRQELLGGEHRETLEALKEMGSLWSDQNRYQEAEELCRQTLDTARRVLGDNDNLTLSFEHIIAQVVTEQGRLDESEGLLRRCLERETRILGEEHPDTLETMGKLARLLGEMRGNWQEAEPLGRRCMEVRERTLGKDHPDTLDARNNFADSILRMEGKWQEAEKFHRETLAIARRVLGPKHDTTLTVEHNLAIILGALDQLEEAEKCFRECVDGRVSILGRENPEVLRARKFLAEVLCNRGKWDEAEQVFADVLEVNRRVMGPDEATTLATLAGIASVHRAKGKWGLAEETLRRALKTCRQGHGPEDLTTLFLTSNLAAVLEDEGKHGEAKPFLLTMLQTQRKRLPPDGIISGCPRLAICAQRPGRAREAHAARKSGHLPPRFSRGDMASGRRREPVRRLFDGSRATFGSGRTPFERLQGIAQHSGGSAAAKAPGRRAHRQALRRLGQGRKSRRMAGEAAQARRKRSRDGEG